MGQPASAASATPASPNPNHARNATTPWTATGCAGAGAARSPRPGALDEPHRLVSPTSKLSALLPVVLTMQEALRGKPSYSILDIGPGMGKVGLACREYLGTGLARLEAVEAESRYVTPLLWEIYDHIEVEDCRKSDTEYLSSFDLAIMCDVIEHMPASDGHQILQRFRGDVVITTPRSWFQNAECVEFPSETHHCVWTRRYSRACNVAGG